MINTKSNCKEYLSKNYISSNKLIYSIYVLLRVAFIALSIYIPIYLSESINNISSSNNGIFTFVVKLSAIAVVELVIACFVNDLNIRLSNKIAFQIEFDTLRYIKYARYKDVRKFNDAYLTQRINNDAVCIGDFIVEKAPYFVTNLILVLAILPIVFMIHITLGLLLISVIVIYYVIYFTTRSVYYKRNKKMLESQGKFFSMLSNQIFNVLTIKINSWYSETDNEFVKVVTRFFKNSIKFLRIDFTITNLALFLNRIAYGVAIIVVGSLVIAGEVTIGDLAIIVIYVQLLLMTSQKLTEFGKNMESYKVSRDRIKDLFELEPETNGDKRLKAIDLVETNGLTVSFDKKVILKNKTLLFEKGKVYLLKGENGSGKTTFISALLGIIKPHEGFIKYHGYNLNSIDAHAMRKELIAFTEQEPFLQEGTIFENLTYGLNDSQTKEIKGKINKLPLLDFVQNQTSGYDAIIDTKKTTLSGGEKQKIAICRSLIKNTKLLIFDEPSSALDSETIQLFIDEIARIKEDKIIIIISHDIRMTGVADKVYDFDNSIEG